MIAFVIVNASTYSPANGLPLTAALENCRLDTWSVRDGLPPHEITCIAQGSDGFMYVGTDAGLLRFDGASFRLYNSHNTPGLHSNMIASLAVDHSGVLWVGTELGGAGTLVNGVFTRRDFPIQQWHRVWALVPAPNGDMWIGMNGKYNLQRYHNGTLTTYSSQIPAMQGLALAPGGGLLCARPEDGLLLWRSDKAWHDYVPSRELPTRASSCVLTTRNGVVWTGTPQNGLIRIEHGKITNYRMANGLASDSIRCLYEDREGRLWIGTNNGLSVWDGHSFSSFGKDKGLTDSTVNAICEDREGNLWVGTAAGLNKFAATKLRPITLSYGTVVASMPYRNSLAPSTDGGMWCATDSGLWHLKSTGQTRFIPVNLGVTAINGVCADGDTLWLWGTDMGHCVVVHAPVSIIERFEAKSVTNTTAVGRRVDLTKIRGIEVARCNSPISRIIVGVPNGNGLLAVGMNSLFSVNHSRVTWLGKTGTGYEFTCRKDPSGTAWVGCGNGLVRIRNGKCAVMNKGLPAGAHVLGIDATEKGCLWLATDRGVGYFSGDQSTVIGTEAGLPDSNLFEILRDGHGKIWIGYSEGLFWIRENDVRDYLHHLRRSIPCHTFGASAGIRSFPQTFMAEKSTTGQLWFCGLRGLTVVESGSMAENRVKPIIAIESAVVNGRPIHLSGHDTIAPGAGTFRVEFTALSYTAPELVRFRYQLQGLTSSWVDVGNRRSAEFTNLSPGDYRFTVVGCNNDGVWNSTGASVSFRILPHYYEALWFKSLCAFLLVVLVLSAHVLRSRTIVRRNIELEEKVRDRTSELVVANSSLNEAKETLEDQNLELQAMQAELEAQNDELIRFQSHLAEANERLEALATTDGLTGLKNHRTFQEKLSDYWEQWRRTGRQFSLILLDVDKFKQFNDTYGHPAGDDVLKTVARILSETARSIDCVARYGGEEFVILSPETDTNGARILAERLRAAVEAHDWPQRAVTASFGVAVASLSVTEATELVAAADGALYESKKAGRNRVTLAGDPLLPASVE